MGLALTLDEATVGLLVSIASDFGSSVANGDGVVSEDMLVFGSTRTLLLLAALMPTRRVFATTGIVRSMRLSRRWAGRNESATDLMTPI